MLFEIEIYVMDMGTSVMNLRYGLVAIDNFTNITNIVPIQNKQPDEIIRAVKEVLTKIGTPKQTYPDEEGSLNSPKYIRCINKNKVKHIQTSTHAPTAERFILTFKDNFYRRLTALNQ